jgi:hypothetical protein
MKRKQVFALLTVLAMLQSNPALPRKIQRVRKVQATTKK